MTENKYNKARKKIADKEVCCGKLHKKPSKAVKPKKKSKLQYKSNRESIRRMEKGQSRSVF